MKVGEIVAVETTAFTAQSYELNRAPAFGALLRIPAPGDLTYYALCHAAQTGSIEPGRQPVAWGRFEDDEDDIYRRQPQLSQVLRTTFDALLVGYADGQGAVAQRVPARPPRLHALVYEAEPPEVAAFNANVAYLRFIVRTPLPNADDFIAAVIAQAYCAVGERAFLVGAARTVARLLEPEHERVMNVLELLDG